jgi:hypothetical protein
MGKLRALPQPRRPPVGLRAHLSHSGGENVGRQHLEADDVGRFCAESLSKLVLVRRTVRRQGSGVVLFRHQPLSRIRVKPDFTPAVRPLVTHPGASARVLTRYGVRDTADTAFPGSFIPLRAGRGCGRRDARHERDAPKCVSVSACVCWCVHNGGG